MRRIMYAVYVGHHLRGIFFTKWAAENYIEEHVPEQVKRKSRIDRVEVIQRTEIAFDVFKHEYKRI